MVVIRSARSSDRRQLVEIGLAAWERAVATWGEDVARLRGNAERAYAGFVQDHWTIILVAEDAGQAVGWGARETRGKRISDLWIWPDVQRCGFGSALLDALEGEIRTAGYTGAEIETHARNAAAIDFFKSRGYAVSALTVSYAEQLDRDIEQVLLKREFEP